MIQLEITTTEVGTTEQVTTLVELVGAGPQGPKGEDGTGLPDGGDTGEILVKLSAADQDASWTDDYATAAQGSLADTATQPGDNVSTLTNDANYIDAAGAPVQSVDGFTGTVDLSGEYDALGSASAVQSSLTDHENATTSVHGIADTSQLIVDGDVRLTDERTPLDGSVTDVKVASNANILPTKINGTAVVDNDPRLTDQRIPTDGSVTDAKIVTGGLSPSIITGTAVIDSDARLSDERTPVDGSVTTAKIDAAGLAPSAVTGTAVVDSDARLTDERTPLDGSVTSAKIDAAGISPASVTGTAVVDNDGRLSDNRTPVDGSVTDAKVAAGANIQQSKIDGLTASLSGKANLVAGKVPQSELPAIALTEVDVVADIPARDALTVQEGDVAIVQDAGAGESISYIYDGTAWQEILTPTGGITNVTGSQGLNSTGGTTPDIFIVDGGVTNAKLAGNIAPTKITGTAVVDGDARLSEGAPASETVRSLGTLSTQALPGDYDVAGQAPVQSVNTQTGSVTLTATDVGAYPNTNPSNFIDAAGAPVQSVDGLTGAVDLSGEYDAFGSASNVQSNLTTHINDATNPHNVTKAQVGLSDVDNVSAADLRDRATHTGTQALSTISDAGTMASQDASSVAITGGDIDADLAYNNSNSDLSATLVQSAIDELDVNKLNVSALTASVKFFATNNAGVVPGYGKLVTDTADPDYNTTAVSVSTGTFSGADNLVGELVSDAGVLEGNTTPIEVTTVGNVRRATGNSNDAASFKFEVYKRDSGGTETLIGTSLPTKEVRSSSFEEFFASALIDDTPFTLTDRVVLKFYASVTDGPGGRAYEFQYGGSAPVRTLFPVPVTVVPRVSTAADLQVDASGFSGLLSGTDDDAQAALNTLDGVTKSDLALGNVPNLDTTDAVNKAHEQNTDTALASGTADEVTASDIRAHLDATDNPHSVTASQVGLGNVDNTSDLDKPISTATQSALDDKADNTVTITGTNGIEGGGDLTANRALALTAATLASLDLADSALQSGDPATDLAYDNTTSGLTATTVQGAIDEIVGILNNVLELNTGS